MENLEETDEIDGSYGGPYMVEKILAIYVGKNRKKYYRVKWVDSWEPEDNLSEACQPLIDEFWSSPVHDPTGGEINRTDLKSGQKIIKREHLKSIGEESNPESPSEQMQGNGLMNTVVPTLKYDLESPTKKLKKELVSPTDKCVKEIVANPPDLQQATVHQPPKVKKQSISDSIVQTDVQPAVPLLLAHPIKKSLSSQCVASTSTSTSTSTYKNPASDNRKKSVDCQTQTSDDEEFPPQILTTTDTTSAVQTTITAMCDTGIQHNVTTANVNSTESALVQPDVDATSELSFSESDVVDLASEEENELEITMSTPSKRQCIQKPHPASTSCLDRRNREKVTLRRRRNSEGEGSTPTRPPLHPRSLLPTLPAGAIPGPEPPKTGVPPASPTAQMISKRPRTQHSGRKRPLNLQQTTHPAAESSSSNNTQAKLTDRTCNICKHTFPNLTQARQHFKRVHVPTSTSNSSQGAIIRNNPGQVNQARNNHGQVTQARNNPGQVTQARNNPGQVTHPRNNSGQTQVAKNNPGQVPDLTCHVCFAFFRNNRDLKSHMLLHTEKNLQKCDVCLRTFKNKTTLNQHMLIHTDELPHECTTCGKRFRQQGHLILHMGMHTRNNEGTLECPHCSMVFTDNNEFRVHVRSHESELPFQCSQCQERFQNKGDLMKHLEGHNEGRPFTCPTCKKSFKTKTYLFGHMQMHKTKTNNGAVGQPSQGSSQQSQSSSQPNSFRSPPSATSTTVKSQPGH